MSEIRLLPDSQITCVYCLGKKTKAAEMTSGTAQKPAKKEEFVEYMCTGCKYQFKRKKNLVVRLCPYCGKAEKVVAKTSVSADKILSDDDDLGINF